MFAFTKPFIVRIPRFLLSYKFEFCHKLERNLYLKFISAQKMEYNGFKNSELPFA